MRTRTGALVLVAVSVVVPACATAPPSAAPSPTAGPAFSLQPVNGGGNSPSPLVQVEVGGVRAVFPKSWRAEPLSRSGVPREGFVASPKISDWNRGRAGVQGIEAYWVSLGRIGAPSAYYYLAARNARLVATRTSGCTLARRRVLIDNPPDFIGNQFTQSDYIASARGTCVRHGHSTQWAYVVAAPGFGPASEVGIPTSGLYVVVAEVGGPRAGLLLKEMLEQTSFGGSSIKEIMHAAAARPSTA